MLSNREDLQLLENTSPSHSRRAVLKKIVAGTGIAATVAALPEKWTQPVVDKVLVPAHAQTSDDL